MMSRVLCVGFLGLTMFQKISGELLYKDVIEARDMEFRSLESGIMKINPQGPLSLLLGFLAHKLGLDYNMRMYSPEIEPKFKNDKEEYERCWRDDKGVGELGKVFIDLFPSHGGSLSVSSSSDASFSTSLTKDGRDKGVRFLAALMAYSLGGKLEYEQKLSNKKSSVRIGDLKIEKLKREAGERVIRIIEYLRASDSITETGIIEKFIKSKRFLLLSFVFMFLDNNSEMREFLNTFFSLADEGVVKKCFVAEKDYKDGTDYKLLGNIVNKMKLFPFSELNPPPSNMSVNAYSRNKDGGKGGFLNATFSDCVEISLLEFVCCILYDPKTSSYLMDKLKNASPDLEKFFSPRESLFAFDMECRREWFKVVEYIEDERIEYVEEFSGAKNEIEPGFLNLLSLLRSIWNPSDDDIIRSRLLEKRNSENDPKGKKKNRTIEEFKEVFKKMVSITNSGEKSIEYEYDDLRIGHEQNFWNVYGSITLTIGIKGRFKAKIKLEHSEDHAEMNIIKTEFPKVASLEESSKIISNLLSSGNELHYLIGKYVSNSFELPSQDQMEELIKKSVYNAFCNGSLNNDYLRLNAINNFSSFLVNCEESGTIYQSTREMTSNIIANSVLSDDAVCERYRRFFFIDEILLDRFLGFVKKDGYKTLCFIDAVSSNIGKSTTLNYLKKNYESIFKSNHRSIALIISIVRNNREDLFKIIEECQGEEYSGLSTAKVVGFNDSLENFTDDPPHIRLFAERLFSMMSKDEIMRSRPPIFLDKSGLEGFLQMLKELGNGDIDREKQEKLFCYCFYTRNKNYNTSLETLIIQTWDSQNFPIEYVSNCLVKRPNIYSYKVYIALLELILKRSQEESSRIELGEDAFVMISHVAEFILDDKNKDKIEEYMGPLAQKLSGLLNDVQEKRLIKEVPFDKEILIKFVTEYLNNNKIEPKNDLCSAFLKDKL